MDEVVITKRRYKKWTTELVVQALRDYAAVHGEPPKHDDLGRGNLPWPRTVERLYGEDAFTKAMRHAGFTPRPVGQPSRRCGVRLS